LTVKKKIGILTGGGDCPGLNPAIRAVVLRAEALGYECAGILDGWKGMMSGSAVSLSRPDVEDMISRGGTMICTSRTNPFKQEGGPKLVLSSFKKLGLSALVAMGGEDTLGVAARLFREHQFPVVGVPKTMDNDLSATDYTFGFDTAATVAVDAAERLKDTGKSHRRVMVLEVMGRHAGWVSLFTGIASGADYICLPERPLDQDDLEESIKAVYARKKTALVVTSEAIEFGDAEEEKLDEFGHMILRERGVGPRLAALIEKKTGIETRSAVIGHIQRGGAPTLFDRILATRAGFLAMDLADQGKFGRMAALKGDQMTSLPLDEATAKIKTVPDSWWDLVDTLCQGRAPRGRKAQAGAA
jgi:6-phosphofructokinase 1